MKKNRTRRNLPAAAKQPEEIESREQKAHLSIQRTQTTNWSGPLPPPEHLQRFDDIVPGGAERIFQMTEQEHQHRMLMERTGLKAAIRENMFGKALGVLISLAAIAAAFWLAMHGGSPIVATALVGLPIAAVVQAIVGGKRDE
jgi:uncharacterized membrane protein